MGEKRHFVVRHPATRIRRILPRAVGLAHNKSEKIEKVDTIQCNLIDQNGVNKGQGISYYQYTFPINVYRMSQNDSIHVTIRHDMKREILPGISDIGLKVSRMKEQ